MTFRRTIGEGKKKKKKKKEKEENRSRNRGGRCDVSRVPLSSHLCERCPSSALEVLSSLVFLNDELRANYFFHAIVLSTLLSLPFPSSSHRFMDRSASIHCHFNPDRFVICSNNSCHNLILNSIHAFLTGDINYETKFILIYEIWWNRFLFYFTKKIRVANISANYLHLEGQSVENEKRSISWNYVLYRSSL